MIALYVATTHDRWRWKRTLFWFGGIALALVAVGLGAMIAVEQWHSRPQKMTEFWGLHLGATKEDTIAMKGEPGHRLDNDAIWVYSREGGHYHVGFQNDGIRYVLFDLPRRGGSQSGRGGGDRSADALVARYGEPSFISVAKGRRSRFLNFARFNMVFRLVNDEIATVGIYDPALGPIRYIEEAEESAR